MLHEPRNKKQTPTAYRLDPLEVNGSHKILGDLSGNITDTLGANISVWALLDMRIHTVHDTVRTYLSGAISNLG